MLNVDVLNPRSQDLKGMYMSFITKMTFVTMFHQL